MNLNFTVGNEALNSAIAQCHLTAINPANSIQLAHDNEEWVTLWLVPNAQHTGAYAAAPAAFQQHVLAAIAP